MEQLLDAKINRLAQQIGRLERKTDFLLKHLNLEYVDELDANLQAQLAQVLAFLKQGKKMDAVREYRKQTGAQPDEAMVEVEKLAGTLTKK